MPFGATPFPPPLGVIVLGCRVGSQALARRVRAARDAVFARQAGLVVACGGRAWNGRVEADEIARMLEDGGVSSEKIVRERQSLDTHGNARYAANLLEGRGVKDVVVVTCTWHLPRATMLFEKNGFAVEGVGADPPNATLLERAYWSARERVSTWKDLMRRA